MTDDSNLRNKILNNIGTFQIMVESFNESHAFLKMGFFKDKKEGSFEPPFVASLRTDYSIYKNPNEFVEKELNRLFDFMGYVVNGRVKDELSYINFPDAEPMSIITNGFTGEQIHDIEAIEIITSNNKRVRVFQKYTFPDKTK